MILSKTFKGKLKRITEYINDKNKVLSRVIKDLEDVRVAMKCLGEIRNDFIPMDMELILIEETYALMAKFKIEFSKEEQDTVDSLRYNFTNMLRTVKTILKIFYILVFIFYVYTPFLFMRLLLR